MWVTLAQRWKEKEAHSASSSSSWYLSRDDEQRESNQCELYHWVIKSDTDFVKKRVQAINENQIPIVTDDFKI